MEAFLGRPAREGLNLESLETALRRQVLRLAARFLEQALNADTSDFGGTHLPCRCGQLAHYRERRPKTFQSVFGELTLERAYYHCPSCRKGFFPRDRAWGLEDGSETPAVTRMSSLVGGKVSFQEGSELLRELAGVRVSAKQVERLAEALGREIAADERGNTTPLESGPLPPTLYLGVDGTGVPMRNEEVAGRVGKQPDGSAKTREAKLCTVWSAESRDEQGHPTRDPGSVSYTAAIESAASSDTDPQHPLFWRRVEREATRRRFREAPRQAILGDGAPWIWNLAEELYPAAIQIVDRFHAKENLSTLAKTLYGDTPEAQRWAERRHAELDAGRFPELLGAIHRHAHRGEEARRSWQYFDRNRERMRYPQFEAQGLCTSTGVVEAGCKRAIGDRLKRSGMHWTVAGANAITALRCAQLSGGRFQDFWERRSHLPRAA